MKTTLVITLALMLFMMACIPQQTAMTTTASAKIFAMVEQGLPCDEPYLFVTTIQDPEVQDEHGYYGNQVRGIVDGETEIKGYMELIECKTVGGIDENGNPTNGQEVYQIIVDPNNEWIVKLQCDSNLLLGAVCPESFARGMDTNPDYETYLGLI